MFTALENSQTGPGFRDSRRGYREPERIRLKLLQLRHRGCRDSTILDCHTFRPQAARLLLEMP